MVARALIAIGILTTLAHDATAAGRICPPSNAHARLGHATFRGTPVPPNTQPWPVRVFRGGKLIPAARCMALSVNDSVETFADSTVTVEFLSGITVLTPNATLRIANTAAADDGEGSFWVLFGEIFGFGRLRMQDRYVTAGAEGTRYVLRSKEAGATTVTVLEGHVHVAATVGGAPARVLSAGQRVDVGPGGLSEVYLVGAAELARQLAAYDALTGYAVAELPELAHLFEHSIGSRNRLSIALEGSTPIDLAGGGSTSPQVAWSHYWLSLPSLLSGSSLGSRLVLGGAFGQYRSPMMDPESGEEESPDEGTARLPYAKVFLQADCELHLLLRGPVGYTLGLGFHGGWSHVRYVDGDANHFVWGPVVTNRGRWRLSSAYSGLFQLSLGVQRVPVAACPTGCVDLAEPRHDRWEPTVAMALGAEMNL